jgi:hypothetical protein
MDVVPNYHAAKPIYCAHKSSQWIWCVIKIGDYNSCTILWRTSAGLPDQSIIVLFMPFPNYLDCCVVDESGVAHEVGMRHHAVKFSLVCRIFLGRNPFEEQNNTLQSTTLLEKMWQMKSDRHQSSRRKGHSFRTAYKLPTIPRSVGDAKFQIPTEPGEEFPAHFVRSLCTFEAVGNAVCLGLNTKALLWNSSLKADFCNLVCGECGSVYALNSVASSKKVQNLFNKQLHFRGSFAHYHEIKHYIDDTIGLSAKMFLIFATRSNQGGCSDKLPVYLAEIKDAAPNLDTDCFNPNHIRIKSTVVIEPLLNCRPWFTIAIPNDIDMSQLSVEVYHEYFDGLSAVESKTSSHESKDLATSMAGLELHKSN